MDTKVRRREEIGGIRDVGVGENGEGEIDREEEGRRSAGHGG